jgi:hypothetical protein
MDEENSQNASNSIVWPKILLIGLALLLMGIFGYAEISDRRDAAVSDLLVRGASTMSISGGGSICGATLIIRVSGQTYTCSDQGRNNFQTEPVLVMYDPTNPSRCRSQRALGGLSPHETTCQSSFAFLLFYGLVMTIGGVVAAIREVRRQRNIKREEFL